MTSRREALPARRFQETEDFELDGHNYVASAGRYDDGRLGEIFLRMEKTNSTLDVAVSDAAIAVSIALQFGVPAVVLAHALKRRPDGSPASALGVALAKFADVGEGEQAQEAAE